MKQREMRDIRSRLIMGIPVFIIMLAFVLFSISTLTAWLRSDTGIYYHSICEHADNLKKGDFSLSNFEVAGHMSYGYSIFAILGQLLLPYRGMGVRLADILLAVVTIWTFWRILEIVFSEVDRWVKVGITAAFAFSPFLLGIIGEIHSDFPALCFFVWLVYFYVSKRQIACLLSGFLLCFSKEIGILYYSSFFAGCFIYRLVKNENRHIFKKIYDEFSVYEWLLLVPADLFLVRAISSHSWGAEAITMEVTDGKINTVYWSFDYIVMKLKEIFLMNFSWILFIPLILFIVALCRRRLRGLATDREYLVGIGVSMAAFFFFNISYYTYPHYRYLQLSLFFYMVLMIILLEKSTGNILLKRGISFLLAAALFVESFMTVDPVTLLVFRNIDVGNGKVVTTNEFALSYNGDNKLENEQADLETVQFQDSGVYNRDYLGFEKVFEEALSDIEYDSTKSIVFPALFHDAMDYTLLGYLGSRDPWNFYWDADTGDVTEDETKDLLRWTDISQYIPQNVQEDTEVWYLKLPYHGEWYEDENLKYFKVMDERTYVSGKWKIILQRIEYQG